MRPSGIGGQAVIEGVMMKNKDKYAIAVRKPDKNIEVKVEDANSLTEKSRLFRLPIIRGVISFIDSLTIGMKTLSFSASFYEEEDEDAKPSKADILAEKLFKDKTEDVLMGFTMCLSVVLAVAIFMLLPAYLTKVLDNFISSDFIVALIEGVIRIALFVIYIKLISLMKDIQRVFMYHGAEHKCINCIEHGMELNVENVRKSSRQHKRCGTSFMLIVMVVSVIFFMFIRVDNMAIKLISRVLLVPVIAGVSYEFLKLAGRSENRLVEILSKPGMWLQNLTTREPEDDMIEVAISSVEAVFDWRDFLDQDKNL